MRNNTKIDVELNRPMRARHSEISLFASEDRKSCNAERQRYLIKHEISFSGTELGEKACAEDG